MKEGVADDVASLADMVAGLCDSVAALGPRVNSYCDAMTARCDAGKAMMLATASGDLGLVPESRAVAEAQNAANASGTTVTIRDAVTDKVIRTVKPTGRADGGSFATKAEAFAEAKKRRDAGQDCKVVEYKFTNPRSGHTDTSYEVQNK